MNDLTGYIKKNEKIYNLTLLILLPHLVTTNCVSPPTAMTWPPALLHSPESMSNLKPFPMASEATDALKSPHTSIPTWVVVTWVKDIRTYRARGEAEIGAEKYVSPMYDT